MLYTHGSNALSWRWVICLLPSDSIGIKALFFRSDLSKAYALVPPSWRGVRFS